MHATKEQPIVCGTDFSDAAHYAAKVAATFAKRLGTRLLLVRGVDERGEIPHNYWPRLMAEDLPHLAAEAERLRKIGADVQEEVVGGVSDEGVARFAEKAGARLIVVGSRGKGLVDRRVLGSTAEHIANSASVPTLIVRDPAPFDSWLRDERPLKIFVGADFTPASDSALRWVAELRQIAPCEITIGFVDRAREDRAEPWIFDALRITGETAQARARNEHDLRAKAEHWLGVQPVMVTVTAGSTRIDTDLLQLAREAAADLIVVGTHQSRGVSRLRHASVSRRVLRDAQTNVACVPACRLQGQLPEVRRVLVATDLSEYGPRAMPHAYALPGAGGAVCLLHVLKPGEEREQILDQLREMVPAEAAHCDVRTEVAVTKNSDTAGGICEAGERFDADLICIGSHGRSGLLAAAMGSVAHEVIARSSRPVLVVRPSSS